MRRTFLAIIVLLFLSASVFATAFNVNIVESLMVESLTTTATVSVQRNVALPIVTLTTSDSVARTPAWVRGLSEGHTTTAAVTGAAAIHPGALSESNTTVGTVTGFPGRPRSVSETLTTSASAAIIVGRQVSVTQNLNTSSTVTKLSTFNKSVSESNTTSPSVTALRSGTAAPTESLTTSAAVVITKLTAPSPTENLTTLPSVTAAKNSSSNSFNVRVAESLMVESLTTSDASSASILKGGTVSELLATSDSATGKKNAALANPVENLVTLDAATCLSCYGPLSEHLVTVDLVSASKNSGQSFSSSPSESLVVTMTATARLVTSRAVSETLTVTDSAAAQAARKAAVTETLTTSASVSISGVYSRSATQNLITTDNASAVQTAPNTRGVAESNTTLDSVGTTAVRFVGVDVTLSVADAAAVAFGHRQTLSENIPAIDTVGIAVVRANQRRRFMVIETP